MKAAETLLAVCVTGLACFIGGEALGARRATVHDESAGAIETAQGARAASRAASRASSRAGSSADNAHDDAEQDDAFGTTGADYGTVVATSPYTGTTRSLDPRELRIRLANGAFGTYIDDLVNARDSAVTRWPDRRSRPLRVWIDDAVQVDGWNADFVSAVRDAFDTWVQAGVPVHFTFVLDSSTADVYVAFVDRFANGISGKTVWSRDAAWWLVSSEIQLAIAHPSGGNVSAPQMRAIALHEVGHLLGLDHSHDPDNIMSARIRVRDLTEADRATVRLLYSVPAGSLK